MNTRWFAVSALVTSMGLAACSQEAADEAADADAMAPDAADTSDTQLADASEETWTVPRTEWGDPDLTGTWPLDSLSGTPFQRPEELGEQAYLTDEQYAERLEQQAVRAARADEEEESGKLGGGHWFEWDAPPMRQTSLIVEPANGRIPPMTEEGLARAAAMKSSWSEEVFEDLSDFNSLDRCITRGMPVTMINFPYNNGMQIYQSPGYVVIRTEMIHETRIIPVDGRAQLPDEFRPWLGSPRGHWEGDTLVIESSHFNGEAPMVIVGPSNAPVPTSTEMRITERLTLTGPNTIEYEAVVEDPTVLTAPWKMAFPIPRNDSYQLYEYACHEGNTLVPAYIRATSPRFAEMRGEEPGETETFDSAEWLALSVEEFAEEETE